MPELGSWLLLCWGKHHCQATGLGQFVFFTLDRWGCCLCLQVSDMALEDYIAVKPKFARYVPHTAGRYQKKRFRKAQCPIVER